MLWLFVLEQYADFDLQSILKLQYFHIYENKWCEFLCSNIRNLYPRMIEEKYLDMKF